MNYTQDGDRVTIEMTRQQFEQLTLLLGIGLGHAAQFGTPEFWGWVRLVNELNNGNPNFTPYEIPEEYRQGVAT